MTQKRSIATRMLLLLFVLCLAVPFPAALADDEELLRDLPGQWAVDVDDEGAVQVDVAFGADGALTFFCRDRDGNDLYAYDGTWSFELVTDGLDRLTLLFTSTDNPEYAGSGYRVECVYNVYGEGWDENDVHHEWMILEDGKCSGVSPFEDIFGEAAGWSIGLHRETGPNMRVVNCKNYVSLRAKPSATSERRAKVPLGAHVLAFMEYGEQSGFLFCSYQGEYGYILSEYLEPID